jgi:FAD/FMN-containing dehydrogenase
VSTINPELINVRASNSDDPPQVMAPQLSSACDLRSWRRHFGGDIITPECAGYDEARQLYNGMFDRRPFAIAKCSGVQDVISTVRMARDSSLPLAVRGSGHSAAGFGAVDGGIVLDLSKMKGVRVDPSQRVARAQAGVTWREFDHETCGFGLATTGARISSTGISGVTLGGGYGWLMRKYGLTIDNLLSVDIVTADGRLMTVSQDEHEDLFWGVRGAGSNFGVVTSFKYRLHPIGPSVTAGMAFYPMSHAKELLHFYTDFQHAASNELSAQCNFLIAPPASFVPPDVRGRPVVAIAVCHTGDSAAADRDLAALKRLGKPLAEHIKPMSYSRLQRLFDQAGQFGNRVYGRSGHLANLDDRILDVILQHAPGLTSPLSIVMLSPLGGAVAQVGEHETAFSHRRAAFDLSINAVWSDPSGSERHISWVDSFWRDIASSCTGVYVNELGDEGEERLRSAYSTSTFKRLVELKRRYDPNNCFRINHNITPIV